MVVSVFAVRKVHQHLYGRRFTIFTDNKPLIGLLGDNRAIPALTAARIQWSPNTSINSNIVGVSYI